MTESDVIKNAKRCLELLAKGIDPLTGDNANNLRKLTKVLKSK